MSLVAHVRPRSERAPITEHRERGRDDEVGGNDAVKKSRFLGPSRSRAEADACSSRRCTNHGHRVGDRHIFDGADCAGLAQLNRPLAASWEPASALKHPPRRKSRCCWSAACDLSVQQLVGAGQKKRHRKPTMLETRRQNTTLAASCCSLGRTPSLYQESDAISGHLTRLDSPGCLGNKREELPSRLSTLNLSSIPGARIPSAVLTRPGTSSTGTASRGQFG